VSAFHKDLSTPSLSTEIQNFPEQKKIKNHKECSWKKEKDSTAKKPYHKQ
jgi:hypothetical protein